MLSFSKHGEAFVSNLLVGDSPRCKGPDCSLIPWIRIMDRTPRWNQCRAHGRGLPLVRSSQTARGLAGMQPPAPPGALSTERWSPRIEGA
jgi:hypothetical protein